MSEKVLKKKFFSSRLKFSGHLKSCAKNKDKLPVDSWKIKPDQMLPLPTFSWRTGAETCTSNLP